ncbi:c-type cytochrome [Nitrospira sp. Kam-Ns4a]
MWTLFVALLLVLSAAPLRADTENRPFWTEQAMFRFGEDLFFVGRASCAKTVEDGREQAFQRGIREILNYAQAASTAGLPVETQMVFHERDSEGCPQGTVTVWRLLRVNAQQVAALPKGSPPAIAAQEPATARPAPNDLTPRVGMTYDEIWRRFGQPRSITLKGKETHWEYPQFGLTLVLDRESGLTGWKLAGPQPREVSLKPRPPAPPVVNQEPPIDLTDRLQAMEEEAQRAREQELLERLPPQPDRKLGRDLFNGKGACARCHGVNADPARMDPMLRSQFGSTLPDLRRAPGLRGRTLDDWIRIIRHGIPGTGMRPATHLEEQEIVALALYLRHLQGQDRRPAEAARSPQ